MEERTFHPTPRAYAQCVRADGFAAALDQEGPVLQAVENLIGYIE